MTTHGNIEKHVLTALFFSIAESQPAMGRRRRRQRENDDICRRRRRNDERRRWRRPGTRPLDVSHGGAHEPRDHAPPPRLHVEWSRGKLFMIKGRSHEIWKMLHHG